jgi:hypothetical protein
LSACAICGSAERADEYHDETLDVTLCRACGHREAAHPAPEQLTDYYDNTPQDPRFVESLGVTRKRQARAILTRFSRLLGAPQSWLDFGCGRGWFLREARSFGVATVGGFDASALATTALSAEGFAMARSRGEDALWPDWSTLAVPPQQVSLLDVLEHFPGSEARKVLLRLRDELPSLSALIIKVPVSEGIFFRTAQAARKFAPGPYRQLHQTGTFPPHYHYFCRGSLRSLLEQTGFQLVDTWGDRDVDDLFARMPAIAHWPGGALAARGAGLFPADSQIAIAKRA